MQWQLRRGARNCNLTARACKTHGPLDQQRAFFVEAEISPFYAHDAAICCTKGSTKPNRSTASFKAA
jgi:hypothetical protein